MNVSFRVFSGYFLSKRRSFESESFCDTTGNFSPSLLTISPWTIEHVPFTQLSMPSTTCVPWDSSSDEDYVDNTTEVCLCYNLRLQLL